MKTQTTKQNGPSVEARNSHLPETYQPPPGAPVVDASHVDPPDTFVDPATAKALAAITDPRQDAESPENAQKILRRFRKENEQTAEELELATARRWQARAEFKARDREQNRLAKEKADKERAETEKRKVEEEEKRLTSWEVRYRPLLVEFDLVVSRMLVRSLVVHGRLVGTVKLAALDCEDLLNEWDVAYEAKHQWSPVAYREKRKIAKLANEQALRDGISELEDMPSEEEFARQCGIQRGIVRQRMAEISAQINPKLLALATALQDAARSLAADLATAERKTADEWGVKFRPSCVLNAVVWAGFNLVQNVREEHLAGSLICPRTTLFGVLDPATKWQ
jgi:hypothetical protein